MLALADGISCCLVMFWAKQQLMVYFIQNLSLNLSFSDLYLNGSSSSVDNNRWYCFSMGYWVENLQLSFCQPIRSTHEFKWYIKTLWPNGKKMLG